MKCVQHAALGWLVIASLLSGCQSAAIVENEPVSTTAIAERDARLNALESYEFSGGLGIWTDSESISARINWQQSPDSLLINLSGPLGLGDMQLADNGKLAVLTRGNRTVASGSSADTVLQQGLNLQAPVPLQALGFWVRGLPGVASSVKRDASGKLDSLRFVDEQGTRWQARFRRYTDLDGMAVPSLITVSGGPYSVRLLLKNWQSATSSVVPEVTESNNRLPIPDR